MKITRQNPTSKILKVFCYTPISKPLNGSLPQSNTSHFLKLYPIEYVYKKGKREKTAKAKTYWIKGLRGALRHQVMKRCREYGLDVCHSSDKETDKHGNVLLPKGFHLIGNCKASNCECIVHQIFGSKQNEGIISVCADPITSIVQGTAKTTIKLQNVHIATENRMVKSFEGKSIQNFGERYFSGDFTFEIDVTSCNKEQLGLLIESVMNIQKLGRGFNSGYGRIHVKRFQLLIRCISRVPEWDEESFIVKEEIVENSEKRTVLKALDAWHQYIQEIVNCN